MRQSGTSMGKAKVAFAAIPLPCPQSVLLKPTLFPSLECPVFRFIALLPCGRVVLKDLIAIVSSLSLLEDQNQSVSLVLKSHRSSFSQQKPQISFKWINWGKVCSVQQLQWHASDHCHLDMESRAIRVAVKMGSEEMWEQEGKGVVRVRERETVCLSSWVPLPLGESGKAAGYLWGRTTSHEYTYVNELFCLSCCHID